MNLLERLKVRLGFRVLAWTKYRPYPEMNYYYGYCKKHRLYFTDYHHGWREELHCPICEKSRLYLNVKDGQMWWLQQ